MNGKDAPCAPATFMYCLSINTRRQINSYILECKVDMCMCGRCAQACVQWVRFPPIQFGTCNIYSAVTATIIQPPKYVFVYAAISFYACVPLESVGATLSHLRHFQGAYKQYTRRAVCPYRQTYPRHGKNCHACRLDSFPDLRQCVKLPDNAPSF